MFITPYQAARTIVQLIKMRRTAGIAACGPPRWDSGKFKL